MNLELDWGPVATLAFIAVCAIPGIAGIVLGRRGRKRRRHGVERGDARGVYAGSFDHFERNAADAHWAVDNIPVTDRLIAQLRSPLAAVAAAQWRAEVRAGGQSESDVGRLMRITRAAHTLAAAEDGNEDARLAIVEDLQSDLMFAATQCKTDSVDLLRIRADIIELSVRTRALAGELQSPSFFARFMEIAEDYARVMRHARPVCFPRVAELALTPPAFGDELFVFGAGVHGLVPWMYATHLNERP